MGAIRTRRAVASLCLTLVLASCGGDEPSPRVPEAFRSVAIPRQGGTPLAARESNAHSRSAVVILAHQANADMSAWAPLAEDLADDRFGVVMFNFPGFCTSGGDCSAGDKDPSRAPDDLKAVVEWVREGAQPKARIFLVGASMGGTASLLTAAGERVDGVVAVSAPHTFEGMDVSPGVLRNIDEPVLFIAGSDDPARAASAAQYFYDKADDPKQVFIAPSDEHGAPMLETPEGAEARERLIRFLDIYRDAAD